MNFRNSAFIAIALTASVAPAAEAVWPNNSASNLSVFAAVQRFRIYADHCSVEVPQLRPQFESLMERLNSRIQGISQGLLASDAFKGMKEKPVPAAIVAALQDSFDDVKHNFERLDAVSTCPKTLHDLGEMDDESLKSGLTEVLTAVRNMIQMLEKQNGSQALPDKPLQR
ncbi:MAG: hypothetical protein WDO12_08855 [Pseudomonadota bacterium]